ncbi:PH domain-containing protein [Sphingobium phenoxybenzoativorans]|uniref:PH domain-containing protein n=1 Tax=Sphingobium phenoxybenzoativorans TaxID=1592790 RepID=UPI000871DC70|nr:PH domain-containing protein [Sphingobium phenoxybenzoativorans]
MPETWLYDENPAMFRSSPLLFTLLLISVVGILGLGVWWIKCKGERLAVSDREVLMERGLLAKQRTQLNLSTVRTVRISQTVGQRIFGVGNIEIFSAGDYAEIAIRGMRNPNRVRELVSVHNDAQPAGVR